MESSLPWDSLAHCRTTRLYACMTTWGGEWNKHVYNIYIYLYGTAGRVSTSGHLPETRTRVSKSGHPPGTQ